MAWYVTWMPADGTEGPHDGPFRSEAEARLELSRWLDYDRRNASLIPEGRWVVEERDA